ncbi:MAG: hypothetical protein CMF80_03990 [Candidatus Marinimicrobia bacterium]|nr:hypothetical protein [Candidatus Neomarinimicrobiota bacterium]
MLLKNKLILVFTFFLNYLLAESDSSINHLDSSSTKVLNKLEYISIDTLEIQPLKDIAKENKYSIDSLNVYDHWEIIESRIEEAKTLLAEAVISDMSGDTLDALFKFEILFESLAGIKVEESNNEFYYLEYNKILNATITYFANNAETVNKIETGLSTALLKDRLNQYIYAQTLEDLEYVEESVEIIEGHIPITYNSKVNSIIKFFQKDGRRSVQNWLNRMEKYKAIMLPILEEENVPPELFYVAMIESGLNARALSYAYASGYWQFISSTAKIYDLKKDHWVDERSDFEKSTRAAARYFKDLHSYFGDWYLSLAAYNCGQARVNRIIKRQGTRDYWKLTRLPRETRNYVPNVMAAIYVAQNPEKYGFKIESEPLLDWTVKEVDKTVEIKEIAKIINSTEQELIKYNPELKRKVIPLLKDDAKYLLRLPNPVPENFDSLFALIPTTNVIEPIIHKVKYGENLWLIAKKYNVTISDIQSLNKIKNRNKIKPGIKLKIPNDGYIPQPSKVYYTVKRGDTLSEIAQKYKTSVRKIKRLNGLRNNKIRIGQKLEIHK